MRLVVLGPNQIEIYVRGKVILFSYQTPVAVNIDGHGYSVTETRYSNTTQRHINKWLGGKDYTYRPQKFFDDLVGEI